MHPDFERIGFAPRQHGSLLLPEPISAAAISKLIGEIYDCALYPERWQDMLDMLRLELDFHTGSLTLMSLPSGGLLLWHGSGVDQPWMDDFVENMAQYSSDVVEQWGGQEAINGYALDEPMTLAGSSPNQRWRETSYYANWMAPLGIEDVMAMQLARDATSVGSIGLGRHVSKGPIGPRELEAATLLIPHLQRAIAISKLLDIKSVAAATLDAALDSFAAAIILVDAQCRVVHANAAGHEMLASGDPVGNAQGVLAPKNDPAARALERAVAQAAENDAAMGRRGFGIPAPRTDGKPCVLHVLPLKHGKLRSGLLPSATAAIFVAPAVAPHPVSADVLAALFDLTPAEARVVEKIAAGLTPAEAARQLQIGPSTVKTHLAHIFSKTGTRRQADLVALAASLAL